jgi:multicomponent Na+:H+ antiporter subunit D
MSPTTETLLGLVPLALLALSLATGVVILFLPEPAARTRTSLNVGAAVVKTALVLALFPVVLGGTEPEWRAPLLPGIDLVLRMDTMALMFSALSAVLWLVTTVYAIGYLEGHPDRSRFFGFFSLCVTATVGISLAGNLVTFLLFYEMLTLVTYPLVAHYGTPAALKAARLYLFYALGGGLSLLVGVAWLTTLAGPVEFTAGGAAEVADLARESPATASAVFALLVLGLGVKAALFPLHGWLPRAMVAPAPVSALLHAVAVVKAGAFGLVRVVDDVYGVTVARDLGVLAPLLALAAFTILYGSVRALFQDDLKKRLAYSTVSQVSYVALGVALFGVLATTGGVVHLVHQGLMKITLFFCAGLFAEVLGITRVSALSGAGRRMPLTALAFTVGAFGMIGLPPMAGFVSKWQLGQGALAAEQPWALAVLVTSAVLNAAYFLPVVYVLWFRAPDPETHPETDPETGPADRTARSWEAPRALLLPALTTAALALAAGLLAGAPYSPLDLARLIAEGSY